MPETKEAAPKLAKGIVAKGRTVTVPSDERRIAGYTAEGKPVYQTVQRVAAPGEEVELPAAEIAHLRLAGFLVDPDAPAVVYGAGPRFGHQA
ncbi:hypothetical protein MKK75_02875 [Methylobacterium sp. J-030]|uniref:hypothetical protein n=1 Tax=Methylobacterium sp. J-030 TaxID=2836627 RepID=UPI001FBBC4F0|nr:hypothetical protein [Methylobacterium sp. J-030]MCJ2067758.1 hypothetical protein [Methylobacterium sp. J-030]